MLGFALKIFNSVVSLPLRNFVRGLFWTGRLEWYHRYLFLAVCLLALSPVYKELMIPWAAVLPKHRAQDQAREFFFLSVIISNVFHDKEPQDNLWNQQPRKHCPLEVMWLQFSCSSAWGCLRGHRANCSSVPVGGWNQPLELIDICCSFFPVTLVA